MTTLPTDCPQFHPAVIGQAYETTADYLRDVEAFLQSQEPAQQETVQ